MIHRTLVLLGAVALATFCSPALRAQDSGPAPPPQTAQAASPQPAAAAQPAAKKVWTNDDLGGLRETSAVSTVGAAKPAPGGPVPKSASSHRGRDARSYEDQIARLRAQIPPLEQKISELQSALSGNQVTESRQFGGTKPGNWNDQLGRLQKQRDDIQAKIATLEDEARHRGAPGNQIP